MVDVICDTNFIIHVATKNIRNIDTFNLEVCDIKFIIPQVVVTELLKLKKNPSKKIEIEKTLKYIENLEKISILGKFADDEILNFVKSNRCFVGTMDKKLKKMIKNFEGNIISIHNENLILEPAKFNFK